MFRNLRKYFYDNKVTILRNIAIIVLIIIAIQTVNNTIKNKSNEDRKKYESEFSYGNVIKFSNSVSINNNVIQNSTSDKQNITNNNGLENNTDYIENDDIIEQRKQNRVETFLNNCINGNIQEAYDMLSDECKNILYPDINTFKENYYSHIFGGQRVYTIDKYLGDTYRIKIAENFNSTGSYSALAYEEYITVSNKDGIYKLNISHYIGRTNINKSTTEEKITVKVNYKDVFMDQVRYNITVTNKNTTTIKLDSKEKTDTMYLLGDNNIKYYAYSNELIDNSLILESNCTTDLNIRYKKSYKRATNSTRYLVFSNIILDYDTYKKLEDKLEYNNIKSLEANI